MKFLHLTLILLQLLFLTSSFLTERLRKRHHSKLDKEFCWKDTYGRGVGTIPTDCAPGRVRIGLLCYSKCPEGYKRFGFDCHSKCPEGFRDDGLFCRKAEYGRGGGYPWKFGDSLNDKGMFRRCEKSHGKGGCQKYGLIVYPKCKAGYHNFGCCICRPPRPKCSDYNLNPGIDLSCAKKIKIGDPVPGICPPNKEKNVGLCYPACRPGFTGVGPVCWGSPPNGWVNCGMGAAKDKKTCSTVIINQISSVGTIALNIATLGSSGAATTAVKTASTAGKLSKMKTMFNTLKTAYEKGKKVIDTAKKVGKVASKAKKTFEKLSGKSEG